MLNLINDLVNDHTIEIMIHTKYNCADASYRLTERNKGEKCVQVSEIYKY